MDDSIVAERERLQRLWRMCLKERGAISGEDFREVLIALLFMKFLRNDITRSGECIRAIDPWTAVDVDLGKGFNRYATELAAFRPAMADIFEDIDFASDRAFGEEPQRNRFLWSMRHIVNDVRFDAPVDPIEFFLERFATLTAGSGAVQVPPDVARLLVDLVEPGPRDVVCNPACGVGDVLVACCRRKPPPMRLYGIEAQGRNRIIARMRLAIQGHHDAHCQPAENGLPDPFSVLIAGLAWNWEATDRLSMVSLPGPFAGLTPQKCPTGLVGLCTAIDAVMRHRARGAIIIPHGPLFRQGVFRDARAVLVKENVLDAIIGLPAGIFHGASIPTAVLLLRTDRKIGAPISCIDASDRFADGRLRNVMRTEVEAAQICAAYQNRQNILGFARLITAADIAANDGNLSLGVYVPRTTEAEATGDPEQLSQEIQDLDTRLREIVERRRRLCENRS